MEDLWKRAKGFAEEAAKKSQNLTNSTKISDIVSETAKKSRELAAEASKQADLLKTAAFKQADQIKSFSSDILVLPPQLSSLSISNSLSSSSSSSSSSSHEPSQSELIKFGLADDLIVFVKGLTSTTFQSFPIQDEMEGSESDVPATASNVRKDLTEWQERHATLILTTVKKTIGNVNIGSCRQLVSSRGYGGMNIQLCYSVFVTDFQFVGLFHGYKIKFEKSKLFQMLAKYGFNILKHPENPEVSVDACICLLPTAYPEMSRLRYELCPRVMKERRFWKIYFTLVSSYVAPYEKRYVEEVKLKEAEKMKDEHAKQTPSVGGTDQSEGIEKNLKGKTSKSSSAEQDLDTFLLGDLEDSDGGSGMFCLIVFFDVHSNAGEGSFDDDFDKIDNSDVEDEKHTNK
ncbi:hypothetical protein FEM48_Zijuj10G0103700 [Ziziphus jujuba var. spinosa]|uniref:BSD domain-containing protein n=1 Tax=Ziziphus jujuba var. spinosa TaxID=714518 RepID=A0A978UMU0_ZIZJJ|nr:hypothetical protein FEM48_Zijuj10G0103700 [Ziziphus jujuba var. spinosa]